MAEDATREALHAHTAWFGPSAPAERSPLDLNHLAHALWGAHRFADAAQVFDAIGPCHTPVPWAYRTAVPGDHGEAAQVFLRARTRSRSATPAADG